MKLSEVEKKEVVTNHNGEEFEQNDFEWAFNGLHLVPAQLPFHHTPVPVDPENPPKNMPGFWKGFGTEGDYNDDWVMDLSVIVDDEGNTPFYPLDIARLPNESAPEYVGDVYVVKRLYNTQTCSEVPLDIEATDLAALRARFPHANFSA
jgi:hypothetical protein